MIYLGTKFTRLSDEHPYTVKLGWIWEEKGNYELQLHSNWNISKEIIAWCDNIFHPNNDYFCIFSDYYLDGLSFVQKSHALLFVTSWRGKQLKLSQFDIMVA